MRFLRFLSLSLLGLLLFLLAARPAYAQLAPVVRWDRVFGGNQDDGLASVEPTADGGYLLGGWSRSGMSGDKTQPNLGRSSYWIVKVDSSGAKQWDRSFGSRFSEDEALTRAVQTADGGYLLAGSAYVGASGDKTHPGWGYLDFWVIRLDAQGTKLWDRAYGGAKGEALSAMQLTADGGFILAGSSDSEVSGDKTQPCRGIFDYWIIKLDAQGNRQWDRTIGGTGNDGMGTLARTPDGGYIIGGASDSGVSGEKTQLAIGGIDCWIVKLTAQGQIQWDQTLGGAGEEGTKVIQPTADGGYILGCTSSSNVSADKSQPSRGLNDYWVLKLDAQGNRQWDRTLGGSGEDWVSDLRLTPDGGYIIGGYSGSSLSGERTQASRGDSDCWLVRLDAAGRIVWDQAVGGSDPDGMGRIIPLADGGYLLGASSRSGVSGDKTQPNRGANDYWLVRLAAPRITGDALVCAGGQVQLLAPAGGSSYLWSTGATGRSIVVSQPGQYTVTITAANGSSAVLQHQVAAFTPPRLLVSGDTLLCAGQTGQLTVGAPGATGYRWSTGATTAATSVSQPGTYTVTAFFGSGCSRQQTVRVRAQPVLPALTLGNDTTLCEGQTLLLQAPATPGIATRYRWSDGSIASTLRVQQAGTYTLQLTTACETRTLRRRINLTTCLTIPNVVTPNNDQANDRWAIQGLHGPGWEAELFNRWGRRVYRTSSYANDWGNEAPAGTYYYLLRRPATNELYKGWVEVVR